MAGTKSNKNLNFLLGLSIILVVISPSLAENSNSTLDVILSQPFTSPVPNLVATMVVLTFPPGDPGSDPHYHSGPVFGHIVEGEFLMQLKGEPHRILTAGSAFYEKDRATHVWGGNASNNSTCKVVATVYGRPGEPILTFLKGYRRESRQEALAMVGKGVSN